MSFPRIIVQTAMLAGILAIVLATGCRKEKLLTSGGAVRFSTDTLSFDTVFTAQGSFTLGVKIYNNQNQPVHLTGVRLAGGTESFFTLNVDGRPGIQVADLDLAPNDSLYVFATVNIDPTAEDVPFVINDAIIATLNGQEFSLPLQAYGQNAHYIVGETISTSTAWLTDKPYVIIHSALVDSGVTLTIPAGARIYMHQDSRLYVAGILLAEGTKEDSIIFQGDRLDRGYFTVGGRDGVPGEWGGLYFTSGSRGSVLRHVILKNCGAATPINGSFTLASAIQVDPAAAGGSTPQLYMEQVVVQNAIGYGLLSLGGYVRADNCLITDCGANAVALVQGGRDTFTNCTFAIYGSQFLSHTDNPTVLALNYLKLSETQFIDAPLEALFLNCVVFGNLDNELVADRRDQAAFGLRLDHCVLRRTDALPGYVSTANVQLNADPVFVSVPDFDYHIQSGSACVDQGLALPGTIDADLDERPRTGNPDVGCYEVN